MVTSPAPLDERPTRATVPFARDLGRHGDGVAIVGDTVLTYRDLAARVEDAARVLGTERRLVLIPASNDSDSLVTYLAALAAGHPVLLASSDDARTVDSLVKAYDPDVVAGFTTGQWSLDERRDGSAHDLHPDLALLLSTSGSTGSPKLVRLSHDNLQANAEAISEYLGIRSTDRAATTLPMHYCYGLSVINSHLLRGAGLLLTDLSVVDRHFWDLFRDRRGTTFAGVPYTFDLLDRVGFADMDLPDLRYVTQAGGKLAADRVRHYAALGRRDGWDLFVMYGQTEATARMAYLPPRYAASHPGSIGIPVPGGSFALAPVPGDPGGPDTGELVYTGPNVMLGYADTPSDLALGRTVKALHTGDLARRAGDGMYEVVGRLNRFAKVFGLRIDLHRTEALLDRHGIAASCVDGDDELVVVVEQGPDTETVRRLAATECRLPVRAIRVVAVDRLPRLASGKPDHGGARELARTHPGAVGPAPVVPAPVPIQDAATLRDLYAELLDRPDVTEDSSFVSLGGDSLSYVEMSVRLEEALGHLPADWHTTPIRHLVAAGRPRRPRNSWPAVETGVALRGVAIMLIVGTHAHLLTVLGSAHILLAVAGFNFARFQLTSAGRRERIRNQLRAVARIAVPSMVWIAGVFALSDDYSLANVFLLNGILGPDRWTSEWHFWFMEVLVYILLALALLLAVPWADRAERRWPFTFVATLLVAGLLTRFEVVALGVPHTKPAFWLFVLGWAAAKARSVWQRIGLTVVIVATVPDFFGDPRRDAVIAAGIALLLWVPTLRGPGPVNRGVAVLASSSLYIYLTHWQVYPRFESPWNGVAASIAVGVLYWAVASRAMARMPGLSGRGRPPRAIPRPRSGRPSRPAGGDAPLRRQPTARQRQGRRAGGS